MQTHFQTSFLGLAIVSLGKPFISWIKVRLDMTHLGFQLFDQDKMGGNNLIKGGHILFHVFQHLVRPFNFIKDMLENILIPSTF